MGILTKIFSAMNSNNNASSKTISKATPYTASMEELDKILVDSNKAIEDMQKADEVYNQDGDIEKRIRVYEKYLNEKPKWNSFNFNLSLAKMYEKAGRNNDAWGYLNQLYIWSIDPTAVGGDTSKVRYEQFKVLKSEKKYADAMVMLVSSYLINAYEIKGIYFNKDKFFKDAKTIAKKLGRDEESLKAFADDLERKLKSRQLQEKDVQQYCKNAFLNSN